MTTAPFATLEPPLKARSNNADSQVQPWSDCCQPLGPGAALKKLDRPFSDPRGTRMSTHKIRTSRTTRRRWPVLFRLLAASIATAGTVLLLPIDVANAATPPIDLGTASSFLVLAGSGITNTGPTIINGDIGTFPTPTETGRASIVLTGTDHGGDAVTQQAKTDLTSAYNQAAGAGPASAVATELGGRTLTPGVYTSPTLAITGTLYLDTQGDPSAVFVFRSSSTLITASASSVVVLNGATTCNVYWQVGSSATLGTNSSFLGTILAGTSITATTQASIRGRLLAQNGATTLDTNTITQLPCASGVPATATPSSTIIAPLVVPASTAPTTFVPTTESSTTTVTTQVPAPPQTGGSARPAAATPVAVTTPAIAPNSTLPAGPGVGPATPPIAFTGFSGGSAALGSAMVLFGLVLVMTSSHRPRDRSRRRR